MSAFRTRARRRALQRKLLSAWNRRERALVPLTSAGLPGLCLVRRRDPLYWMGDGPYAEIRRKRLFGVAVNFAYVGKRPPCFRCKKAPPAEGWCLCQPCLDFCHGPSKRKAVV